MKHAKLAMTLLFLFLGMNILHAQNYNMTNGGSISTCSGTFYDSGGSGGDYGSNETLVYTICPSTPGQAIQVNFTSFDLENSYDNLSIYDGNSTGASLLGTYSGTTIPGAITATTSNPSGCLTFRFTSDGSLAYSGWAASISCVPPVPPSLDILMQNGSTTTCSGTFYDSGGNGSNYGSNENNTFTICPDNGGMTTVDFTSFELENGWDFLTIYDGSSTGAPSLGTYTGTAGPGFVSATASNASGCLTFVFTSDVSGTRTGWAANIGCAQPCQDIIANAIFSPAPDGDGIIRICQGTAVTMNGTGVYPDNNTSYPQSDATSTFTWSTQDGPAIVGQSVTHTYTTEGAYIVQLEIEDVQGCSNANDIDQEIRVSTTPHFTGTAGSPDPICLGEQAVFNGLVTPVTYEKTCDQPNFPPISLPDGSGVSYQTSVNIDCYGASQSVTNISDIVSICLDIEHSYLGDLDIVIECPNGQTVSLKDYPGGSNTFLGEPVDDDGQPTVQGVGYNYCFDPTATNGTLVANGTGGVSLPAGSYESANSMGGLIGCDLNGDWTLIITDHLGSDNGFIFDWSLNFDPAILPPAITFTPTIVTEGWQADPTIVGGTNPITVEPTSTGNACYTFEVTDNFGCDYDTTVCITVDPSPVIDPVADVTQCNPFTLPAITGVDLTGNEAYYTGMNGTGTQYNPGDVISATTTLYIYDRATVAPFCENETSFTITIINAVLTMNCPPDLTAVCDISEQPAYANFAAFQAAGGSASTTGGASVLPATFTLLSEVSDGNTCPEVITRTYQIEDDCGNTETCTQTITINDIIPPTGTAPADLTVQCIGDVPAADVTLITDEADNCTVNPVVTHVSDVSDGNTCPEVITRTYNIADDCGNNIDVVQTITIDDNTNPTASNPAPVTVECLTDVPPVAVTVVTDAADNCTVNPTVAFVSESSDNNTCNGEVITRIYSVTDDCGNSINVTHTITVDSYTPTFTVSSTDPTACGASDGTITISGLNANTDYIFSYDGGANTNITTDAAGEYVITGLPAGSYTDYTVSDVDCPACNTTENVTMTLTDPNPPAIDAGADQVLCEGATTTLNAINPDGATVTWDNGVTDGTGFTPPVGTTTYTVTANLAGCTNSDQMTVTVAPSITELTCPGPLTATCGISEQPAYADYNAFITAGGSVTIPANGATVDPASFTLLSEVSDGNTCPEVVTRTYQVADTCGVTVTCTQTITINDLIAPTGTAPADLTVQCIGDVPAANVALITDEADNCTVTPTVTHVSDVSDGNTCPEVITRTYRITDDCGNSTDVVQSITIDDNTNPTGTAPADLTVQCIGDVPAADVTLITDEADNCTVNPIVTHVSDVSDGNTCPEVITRTYNIADDCGNNIDVVQTITIDDNTNPTASNPAPVTVECLTDVPPVAVTVVTDAADNCTVNPTVAFVSESSDNNTCNGEVITRIYSVTDDCGNSINVTHTITVDSYTPTFTVSSTDPTACGASDGTITISGLNANTDYIFSYDGGAGANITTDAAGEYVITGLPAGSYTDYTVSDVDCPACNTTENVTMTLTDPNAPAIDAGVDQEVCEGETVTLTAVNPDGATITWDNGVTDGVGFVSPVGTTNYTVTAEIANCFSSDVVSVLVHPTPTVSAGNDVEVCDGAQVTLQGSGAATYVWDNGVTDGTPFTPSVGTITYSVVGTSAFGCEASDQVDVTVNENPEVLFEADVTEGCTPLEVNLVSLTPGAADCQFTIEGMQIDGCDINYTFTNPGCYDVNLEVESVNGCVSDLTLNNYICIDNYPIADFTVEPGQLSNMNDEATFVNGSIGAETYDWSFGDGETSTENNPIHTYSVEEDGEDAYEIQLIAYSELGCPDTAYVKLPFIEDLIYYVPNTFTPDGNKYNETFKPVFSSGFDPHDYNLKIFNRWGELIFESQNAAYGWDGTYGVDNNTIVKEGVYVWKIEFKKKYNDERIELVGHVNLLK